MKGEKMNFVDIAYMWPKHSDGRFVEFDEELPQFCGTIYKKVRSVKLNEYCYVVSNGGGSAEILIIGDYGVPVEEARTVRAWR